MSIVHCIIAAALAALLALQATVLAKPETKHKDARLVPSMCPEPYVIDATGVSVFPLWRIA